MHENKVFRYNPQNVPTRILCILNSPAPEIAGKTLFDVRLSLIGLITCLAGHYLTFSSNFSPKFSWLLKHYFWKWVETHAFQHLYRRCLIITWNDSRNLVEPMMMRWVSVSDRDNSII